MNTQKKTASILGGKTAKGCDSCLRQRARWYCAADDAYLCKWCDASVHSANRLASRHERVRLESSSCKGKGTEDSGPAWYRVTRKARTPRQAKSNPAQPSLLVPEINSEDTSPVENEDQLLYRVPVFEPFDTDIFTASNPTKNELVDVLLDDEKGCDLDINLEFITSDAELAEFAADVESLLGTGIEEDSHEIELGLARMDCKEEDIIDVRFEEKRVKVEDDDDDDEMKAVIACHLDPALDMARRTFNWNSDYASPLLNGEADEEKKVIGTVTKMIDCQSETEVNRKTFLTLNYEAVIAAWASQGSPWTNGIRPEFFYLNDFLDTFPGGSLNPCEGLGGWLSGSDAGRRARVSRYRDKRRKRLFSKKIRYEVRKLNAEKRPRMKGRFVKRTTIGGSVFFPT